ncbi:hypothetical protein LG204_10270 [Methylovorus menthalis]|uniref:hypothetical protein n=1 Tax=Methylovorus menthalis TaxID=1002227 RepID=UPI001E587C6E|nr:hypothetical protein [Methylovorus menthalis]MCB4811699.1 hypothetical protein [Methylovorus menthalis]
MSALGSLIVKLALEHAEYTQGLDKSSQQALKYGQSIQRSVDQAEAKVSQHFSNTIRGAAAATAAYLGVSSAVDAFNNSVNDLAALDDLAQKTGGTVENLSRMQKVAVQFGQDFSAIDPLLIKFAKNLNGVDDESSKAAMALQALGISQDFVRKNDPSAVFIEVTKRLQNYADGAQKVDLVTDLMGKSAADSLPYFNDLAENVDKFTGVSAEAASKAATFQDNLGKLKVGTQELIQTFTIGLLPKLTEIIDKLNDLGNSKGIQSALVLYGTSSEDYAAKLAETESKLQNLIKTRDELSKPTAANKINDFLFGDVLDLNNQIKVAQDVIATLKPLVSAKDKLDTASPYVTPNSDKPQLNYVSAEISAQRQAAAQKLAASYNTLIGKSGDYITAMQYEASTDEKVTAGQKQIADLQTFLIQNYASLSANQRAKIEADIRGIATEDALAIVQQNRYDRIARMAEVDREALELQKTHTEGLSAARAAYEGLVTSEEDQIKSIQDQIDVLTLGREAANNMKSARLLEAAAAFEQNAAYAEQNGVSEENIKSMRDRAQALRDLAAARDTLVSKQVEFDYLTKIKNFAESTWDSIGDGLTNALFRGFEDGKSFADNFFDTLKNTAKTTVLKFTTEFIMGPLKSVITSAVFAASGTANAGGLLSGVAGPDSMGGSSSNSLGSLVSLGKNLYSAFTTGMDGLNSAFVGKIGDLGTFLVDKGFNNLGGMIGQYSSQIANVLPYSAAILKLAQGDMKGAAITGITTAIGSMWGPAGGAIGAAVGSLLSNAFGSRKKNPRIGAATYGVYEDGEYTSAGADKGGSKKMVQAYVEPLANLSEQFATQLGSFLDSMGVASRITTRAEFATKNKKGTIASLIGTVNGVSFGNGSESYSKDPSQAWSDFVSNALGKTLVQAIQASQLTDGIKSLFNAISDKTQVVNMMNATVSLNTAQAQLSDRFGLTVDAAAKVAKASDLTGDSLVEFVNKLSSTALSFKSTGNVLVEAVEQMRDRINDIIGDVAYPITLDQFDQYLKNIDTTTSEGIKKFQELFDLRDTFTQLTTSINSIKDSAKNAIYDLLPDDQKLQRQAQDIQDLFAKYSLSVPTSAEELVALYDSLDLATASGLDLAAAMPSLVEAFKQMQGSGNELVTKYKGYAEELKAFGQSLLSGANAALSPESQYSSAKAEYERISALAASGNADALSSFTTVAQQFLDASKDYFSTSSGYFADLENVKQATGTAELSALAKSDVLSVTGMTSAVAAGTAQANTALVTELRAQNDHLAALVALQQAANQTMIKKLDAIEEASKDAASAAQLQASA